MKSRKRKFHSGAINTILAPPPSPEPADLAELETILDYKFRDPNVLREALTHSSHPDLPSYQRLEFVGDAALGLAFTNYFYLTNPGIGPGSLSVLRSANISTEKLARAAVRHDLYRFLRRNSPKLDEMVSEFSDATKGERDEDYGGIPYGGSVVKAPKVLADIVESIAAAIYVDCNFDLELLWKVFRGFLEPIITAETLDEQPVTMLYELCQKHHKNLLVQKWKKEDLTITNFFVDDQLIGIGTSEQKEISKLNAARDALRNLCSNGQIDMEIDQSIVVVNKSVEENEGSKRKLNELCTKKKWSKPIYRLEKEDGPAHDKRFICSVQIDISGKSYTEISNPKSRVKDAENAAASKMLSTLEKL